MSKIMELVEYYATLREDGVRRELEDEARAALAAEVEKLEKDAARYRFAQSKYWVTKVYSNGDTELMYDNDIDAAMEATK